MLKTLLKRHRYLALSLLLGILGFASSYQLLSAYTVTRQVVVARRDIEVYHQIAPDDVALREFPVRAIPPGCFQRVDEVVGSCARSRLVSGQIILGGHVLRGRGEIGFSMDLPEGSRAVFIPAGPSRAIGGLVKKGERVDVIFAARAGNAASAVPSAAQTILRAARVLEVVRDTASKEVTGVLVMVSSSDCELVARCMEIGDLYLALVPAESSGPGQEVWRGK